MLNLIALVAFLGFLHPAYAADYEISQENSLYIKVSSNQILTFALDSLKQHLQDNPTHLEMLNTPQVIDYFYVLIKKEEEKGTLWKATLINNLNGLLPENNALTGENINSEETEIHKFRKTLFKVKQ